MTEPRNRPDDEDGLSLTERQRRFCELLVAGQTQWRAWINAGNGRPGEQVNAQQHAYRFLRSSRDARKYIAQLRKERRTMTLMTFDEKRAFLASIVRTPVGEIDASSPLAEKVEDTSEGQRIAMPSKLKAIEIDNRMTGDERPSEVSLSASNDLIRALLEVRGEIAPSDPSADEDE